MPEVFCITSRFNLYRAVLICVSIFIALVNLRLSITYSLKLSSNLLDLVGDFCQRDTMKTLLLILLSFTVFQVQGETIDEIEAKYPLPEWSQKYIYNEDNELIGRVYDDGMTKTYYDNDNNDIGYSREGEYQKTYFNSDNEIVGYER